MFFGNTLTHALFIYFLKMAFWQKLNNFCNWPCLGCHHSVNNGNAQCSCRNRDPHDLAAFGNGRYFVILNFYPRNSTGCVCALIGGWKQFLKVLKRIQSYIYMHIFTARHRFCLSFRTFCDFAALLLTTSCFALFRLGNWGLLLLNLWASSWYLLTLDGSKRWFSFSFAE